MASRRTALGEFAVARAAFDRAEAIAARLTINARDHFSMPPAIPWPSE